MADLRVDYAATVAVGQQVSTQGAEFGTLVDQIRRVNGELGGAWDGADAQKYLGAVEQQLQVMGQLNTTINEVGEFLVRIGEAYRAAQEANSAAING